MKYKFNIIVTMLDGSQHDTRREIVARDITLARNKMKNEIMKIGRNGYYTFEDNNTNINPTYFPPTAILSVQNVELNT